MNACLMTVLLALAAAPPATVTIHTCIEDGVRRHQSMPCSSGHTEQIRAAPLVPLSPANAQYIESLRQDLKHRQEQKARQRPPATQPRPVKPRGPRHRARVRGAVISLHADPAACANARQRRDAAFLAAGMQRSFALGRRMDARVQAACR